MDLGYSAIPLRSWASLLAQQQVHNPASPDVWPWPPQVVEDFSIGAAGFLNGIGQNSHAGQIERPGGEVAVVVHRLGQFDHGPVVPCQPARVDGNRVEGVAEDVTENSRLMLSCQSGTMPPATRHCDLVQPEPGEATAEGEPKDRGIILKCQSHRPCPLGQAI